MTLHEYIRVRNISIHELAAGIEVSYEAARRYIKGERVPRLPILRRIQSYTHGLVTHQDFS